MRVKIIVFLMVGLVMGTVANAADYVVGGGDVLKVDVWGTPELSGTVVVRPDGKITLPAVGELQVSGSTTQQLIEELKRAFSAFVKEPIVTLSLEQINSNKVYISGGSQWSGVVDLKDNMTLFRLLCQLGNLDGADLESAYVLRNNKKVLAGFYQLFVEGDMRRDIEIMAGDILHIPSNTWNRVYVVGAVITPRYQVYDPKLTLLDAILDAGGFNDFANKSNVAIVRKGGKQLTVDLRELVKGKDVSQNMLLQPGDYIIVSESIF